MRIAILVLRSSYSFEILVLGSYQGTGRAKFNNERSRCIMSVLLKVNFLVTLLGATGSLYFSEVMRFTPCVLCWYQRVFLFPLVVIFGAAIWTQDSSYRKYAFPIAIIGTLISIYHNLIYYGLISEALTPCTQGVSCSSKQLELFGFITIPLLSMLSFFIVVALIAIDIIKHERQENEK